MQQKRNSTRLVGAICCRREAERFADRVDLVHDGTGAGEPEQFGGLDRNAQHLDCRGVDVQSGLDRSHLREHAFDFASAAHLDVVVLVRVEGLGVDVLVRGVVDRLGDLGVVLRCMQRLRAAGRRLRRWIGNPGGACSGEFVV